MVKSPYRYESNAQRCQAEEGCRHSQRPTVRRDGHEDGKVDAIDRHQSNEDAEAGGLLAIGNGGPHEQQARPGERNEASDHCNRRPGSRKIEEEEGAEVQGDHDPANEPNLGNMRLVAPCHRCESPGEQTNCCEIREYAPVQDVASRPKDSILRIGYFRVFSIALW